MVKKDKQNVLGDDPLKSLEKPAANNKNKIGEADRNIPESESDHENHTDLQVSVEQQSDPTAAHTADKLEVHGTAASAPETAGFSQTENFVGTTATTSEVVSAQKHCRDDPEEELIFQLAEDFTIRGISDVYDELAALLKMERDVVVDASAIQSVDTAGVQLLLAFSIELENRDFELEWRSPSNEFLQICKLLDLNESLGLEERSV